MQLLYSDLLALLHINAVWHTMNMEVESRADLHRHSRGKKLNRQNCFHHLSTCLLTCQTNQRHLELSSSIGHLC